MATKIDIISGFLGAGKTTLIRKLIQEALAGQKIVLIENEFGEIGIDGGFLKDAGINITEMNSGCICCSLVGDFGEALHQVVEQFHPDRIIIEPSGVGKLSEVRIAVENVAEECDLEVNSLVTVADAQKVKMYMKNFGEFYNDQIGSAGTIVLSRTQKVAADKLDDAVAMIREKNPDATVITTPWDDLGGGQILAAMESSVSLAAQLLREAEEDDEDEDEHHHHHHHHEHDEDHEHEHEHDHDHEHDLDHEHEHDHDHEHEHDHDHEHEHDHDHEHGHHHHHHHHHHGHDADEIFVSWGAETPHTYTDEQISAALDALDDADTYGIVLRAKGMVPRADGSWIHFDMVPGEKEIRSGSADVTGRLCVIGSGLKEAAINELFGAEGRLSEDDD